jgi:hypothetical protein
MGTKFYILEIVSCDTSGSQSFEAAPKILNNLCTTWLDADSKSQTDERI